MKGILYLTREPKLEEEIPTIKAKDKLNSTQNCMIGDLQIILIDFPKPPLNKRKMVK